MIQAAARAGSRDHLDCHRTGSCEIRIHAVTQDHIIESMAPQGKREKRFCSSWAMTDTQTGFDVLEFTND